MFTFDTLSHKLDQSSEVHANDSSKTNMIHSLIKITLSGSLRVFYSDKKTVHPYIGRTS